MDCIFCKIAHGEIPSELLYESDYVVCFKDVAPQAPFHALVVPKQHVSSLDELSADNPDLVCELLGAIQAVAAAAGLDEKGYRVVTNIGRDGGQTVDHLHFHVLGGRSLEWPPG